MYDSPIDLYISDIQNQIVAQQAEQIYQAVVHFVPDVKRDELLKALRNDREQYDKGYADGKRDAMDELVRCKDCRWSHLDGWFCGGAGMMPEHTTLPENFCDHGKRKEAEGNG